MFKLITNNPVALESPDHLNPFGVLYDYHNPKFNEILYSLSPNPLFILDLGCAAGGFIKDCIEDGHLAAGLEGSDIPKNRKFDNWVKYPNNFFTCDITEPFSVHYQNNPMFLDIITAWEVMEHIPIEKVDYLISNIKLHLQPNGLFICSINCASIEHASAIYGKDWGPKSIFPDKNFHHQCIMSPQAWDAKFSEFGMINDKSLLSKFDSNFIRGPGHGADEFATEERYNKPNLPLIQQWCTINRVYRNV